MALTPENIAINEIDSDTPGTDTAEFVELYDGGVGNTDLSGLAVVFYNGSNDQSYAAFDLDGYNTDTNGYFVLGNAGVLGVDLLFPGNTLQNGADAVALYTANASDFPNNTAVTTTNLIDAIAYDTNDADDSGLLALLNPSEPQVDENSGANGSANDSLQRVPNGAGGRGNTSSYQALTPTPSASNTILDVEATLTKIHDIQGSAATFNSAFGGTRTIEGIVVAAFTGSSKLNGFYVQEEDADADTDSKTSEAIFVFDPSGLFSGSVGDKVKISGTVNEFTSSSSGITSSLTQLSSLTSIVNLGANNLPTVTNIQLPVTSVTDLEHYEGMLVNVSAATGDLTVTEQFQLGRFGQVVLSATGTNNQPGTDGRLDQYTQFNAPSVSGYSAYLDEIAKRRIILDDGSNTQNPDPIIHARGGNPLSSSNTLRGGDTVASISGVLDQRFEGYRVQTSTGEDFTPANPRPNTPPNVGGTLKVASFNILNYFNGDGTGGGFPTPRGAENLTEFNRQCDKIIQAIIGSGADALGLIELENDGYGANSAIQNLVNGLNAVTGTGTYTFINPGTSLGTDQIAVGIIYKAGKVTPVGAAATTPDGYGQGAFDATGRKPLAQTFRQNSNGEKFTLVVNHFKSKGSGTQGVGDADAGDGQGQFNGTRTRAAQDLATWLATNPTGNNDPDYLIVGDLNAYTKEDPLTTLAKAGYNNQLSQNTYSYVFDGQLGSLDHALANGSLSAQVTGAAKWHINADEPTVLDYNTNFKSAGQQDSLYNPDPFRSSDHDPVLVGLDLYSIDKTITPPAGRKNVKGSKGNDVIVGGVGRKTLTGGDGKDQFVYNSIKEAGHLITDFQVGSDKIVLTKLLDSLITGGYNGSDAIADGYVRLVQGHTAKSTVLQIDSDGLLGSATFQPFLELENITPKAMNNIYNFVF